MTRNASGKGFQEQTDLSRYLNSIVVAYDEGDEEDDTESGSAGDQGEDEGGEGAEGASGTDGKVNDPDKKRLSDEAASQRVARREAEKALAAAKEELRKLTDKDKTELEKAQRDLTELQQSVAKKDATIAQQGLRLAFYESGAASMFKDQKVARRLLDIDDLTPDDDGNFDEKEIKARADALLKASPYLAADGSDSGSEDKPGQTPNNGRKSKDKASDQKLLEKFPALASRV